MLCIWFFVVIQKWKEKVGFLSVTQSVDILLPIQTNEHAFLSFFLSLSLSLSLSLHRWYI